MGTLSYTELDEIYTVPSSPTPIEKSTKGLKFEFDGIHFIFLYIVGLFLFTINGK